MFKENLLSKQASEDLRKRGRVVSATILFIMLFTCVAIASEAVEGEPFTHQTVIQKAQVLSKKPFKPLPQAPTQLTELDYSQYRQINYQQDEAVWGRANTPFSIQLFAPGFLYHDLVNIDIVENGRAYPLKVSKDSFRVPDPELNEVLAEIGKYAGMRLHYPVNRDDYDDEFVVFQGASFFRGVSRGQLYGLSARGFAIDVAEATGEEHPIFRRFWVERPSKDHKAIVVHALLDSKRVSGAYRFGIFPGAPLRMDVKVTLFPRERLEHVGMAPLTSMFMHNALDPSDWRDYRPAVHDSEGLAIARSNGELLWRPLNNPKSLQASAFLDENPQGFGLIQRDRRLESYQDLEAKYHRRPSAWVKPLGDWGEGHVQLIEIPSDSEANDNIVAYWRPKQALLPHQAFSYSYRLSWPNDTPATKSVATIVRSTIGKKLFNDYYEAVIDYAEIGDSENLVAEATISSGKIIETIIQPHPSINGSRLFVIFDRDKAENVELRVMLQRDGKQAGETWLYRWSDGK